MLNGSIVALKNGVLCPVTNYDDAEMFLVVSDENAKWKGEPFPTPEQEKVGHWCAYLGQVPLVVRGPVRAGQYLGPCSDGSGMARAVELGEGPVVGIALSGRTTSGGIVKAMVSVGLNALSSLADNGKNKNHDRIVERLEKLSDAVSLLSGKAREAKQLAEKAISKAESIIVDMGGLQMRMGAMEEVLHEKKIDMCSKPASRVVSRRRYLWSCLFGLVSVTLNQEDSVQPNTRNTISVLEQSKDVAEELLNDGIVSVALTCIGLIYVSDTTSFRISVIHVNIEFCTAILCLVLKLPGPGRVVTAGLNLFLIIFSLASVLFLSFRDSLDLSLDHLSYRLLVRHLFLTHSLELTLCFLQSWQMGHCAFFHGIFHKSLEVSANGITFLFMFSPLVKLAHCARNLRKISHDFGPVRQLLQANRYFPH